MWTRLGSPSSFVFALICFCLPWIEIRCDRPRGGLFSGQGNDVVLTTQSGLQMTYGGFTTTINGMPPTEQQQIETNRQRRERNLVVPAMSVYALCLLAGLAVSLTVRDRNRRLLLAGSAGLAALVVLGIQLASGFPILEGVPRSDGKLEGVPPSDGKEGWKYTIWLWLGAASTFAAFLLPVAGRLIAPMRSGGMPGAQRRA